MMKDDSVYGLYDDLEIIINRLKGRVRDLDVVTILGMGGIGKTTLAKTAYDHLTIRYHFDILAWVTISQEFRRRSVLLEALHCIPKSTISFNTKVVVDDIWSRDGWDSISRILLTTRGTEVAMYASTCSPHDMSILSLENGWKLLHDKVFGTELDHPPELEEIGKNHIIILY
ncbi:hypothetical protein MTR67_016926 [Solanum verrucosum]|uniref:NB-ARC domain-containing protein n=1 Tax=Solanum verrucosum TaxID=315347 RepID=A0AAF0TL19_SOLVR|nr:hypothetical protein MTR67_016926 [Solanum verrucosum]